MSVDKTDEIINVVTQNLSKSSNITYSSQNTVNNPVKDYCSPMDTSQNELTIQKGKNDQTIIKKLWRRTWKSSLWRNLPRKIIYSKHCE